MHSFHDFCRHALDDIRAQGRYRSFTALRKMARRFPVYLRPDSTEVLIWSSNDYLGMGRSRVAIDAARDAALAMGVGAGGTRNISGTNRLHEELEAELADLHGKDAALLFTSGFVSNQAAISTILNSMAGWIVFSDANHSSQVLYYFTGDVSNDGLRKSGSSIGAVIEVVADGVPDPFWVIFPVNFRTVVPVSRLVWVPLVTSVPLASLSTYLTLNVSL